MDVCTWSPRWIGKRSTTTCLCIIECAFGLEMQMMKRSAFDAATSVAEVIAIDAAVHTALCCPDNNCNNSLDCGCQVNIWPRPFPPPHVSSTAHATVTTARPRALGCPVLWSVPSPRPAGRSWTVLPHLYWANNIWQVLNLVSLFLIVAWCYSAAETRSLFAHAILTRIKSSRAGHLIELPLQAHVIHNIVYTYSYTCQPPRQHGAILAAPRSAI